MAQLKKQLGLLDVFCVAAGAMISSGLFILPALAYAKAGPAVVFSYILAGILVLYVIRGFLLVQPQRFVPFAPSGLGSVFAIPHIIVEGEKKFDVLLIRARDGIDFRGVPDPVKIMFVLAGSKDERNYHLRALMAIAQTAQEKDFESRWLAARNTEALKNLILLSTRKRDAAP